MPINNKPFQRLRLEIAQTAARLIAEDGITDYLSAKRKAAMRLGVQARKNIPTNKEVEEALIDYQKLFQQDSQPLRLKAMRLCAVKAMRFFEKFKPYLVGPVLTGTATRHSEITLHIYCDEPEQIGFSLDEHAIPYINCDKSVRTSASKIKDYPAYRFVAEGITVTLIIFPEREKNSVPFSSIDGKPMQRAPLSKVEPLLETPA